MFGSATAIVRTQSFGQGCSTDIKFSQVIYVSKTHIKALDQPTQRCSQGNTNINTSACIAKYIEKQLGCNPMILGSQYSKTPRCTTRAQLLTLANISKVFGQADENDIYQKTGCVSPCERNKYSISAGNHKVESVVSEYGDKPCDLHLMFRMLNRKYKEEEQYVIYGMDSFIADVGGYMGLLLGSSILSLYMAMEAFLRNLLTSPFKGKIGM